MMTSVFVIRCSFAMLQLWLLIILISAQKSGAFSDYFTIVTSGGSCEASLTDPAHGIWSCSIGQNLYQWIPQVGNMVVTTPLNGIDIILEAQAAVQNASTWQAMFNSAFLPGFGCLIIGNPVNFPPNPSWPKQAELSVRAPYIGYQSCIAKANLPAGLYACTAKEGTVDIALNIESTTWGIQSGNWFEMYVSNSTYSSGSTGGYGTMAICSSEGTGSCSGSASWHFPSTAAGPGSGEIDFYLTPES